MGGCFTVDEMKQRVISILPADATLIDVSYSSKIFKNIIVTINYNGNLHTFTTNRGDIYHNNSMLCNASYQYYEREDTFSKLIEIIKSELNV